MALIPHFSSARSCHFRDVASVERPHQRRESDDAATNVGHAQEGLPDLDDVDKLINSVSGHSIITVATR